jgi:transcription initiation factor TFIID subunit 6
VFESLASDVGLQPLAPYFTQWIAESVQNNLGALPRLHGTLSAALALVSNPRLTLEQYLHQLMPALITCLVAKRVGTTPDEDHWSLRQVAASCLAAVCTRHGTAYPDVQPRLTRTLVAALLDPNKPLATHYGALLGLAALGPHVVEGLVLPNVEVVLSRLQTQLQPQPRVEDGDKQAPAAGPAGMGLAEQARASQRTILDADRVLDALQACCGSFLYTQLRLAAPPVPCPGVGSRKRPRGVSSASAHSQPQPQQGKAPAKGKAAASSEEGKKGGADAMDVEQPGAANGDEVAAGHHHGAVVVETHLDHALGRVLETAWRADPNEGAAMALLADLFGDALVPHVPVAPLACLTV